MGYIVTGYSSRHDKRKKHVLPLHQYAASSMNLQRHVDLFEAPVFYKRALSGGNKLAKIHAKKLRHHRKLSLQDLPIEIIQHIFIFTKGEPSMVTLNWFFYSCLRPSFLLLSKIMWERYLFDPLEFGVENIKANPGNIVIPTLFEHKTFFKLLLDHHHILLQSISHFLPRKHYQDMQDGDFDASKELDLCSMSTGNAEKEDFPMNFYYDMQIFLTHKECVKSVGNHFALKNPYNVISPFMEWFFQSVEIRGAGIASKLTFDLFLESIDLILYVSGSTTQKFTSIEPLSTLVFLLYFTYDNVLQTPNFEVFFQNRSRLRFMEEFIIKYYYDPSSAESELLSDTTVWDLLRRVSDLRLIDLVVECGGRPQYGVMFS
ncbi:uncharacterized protein SKDI_04G4640 [Saccharomyces kudriavzevii IFO 1802]|uniref:YDR249C-like protein n=2 Tax=Saccharomyces kudriavzevii (strain ATCC MYA-4449 / AS 2.2408 / CBS 8840 / NBRC 1802 / NCYC 2889) TaxID=226230 RepID=J6EAL8_SACK1|nr:uncharacterized protein SKDI_04G4640 [Saccharomyces kudriavzevii IFO 1802]EJT41519.1 YDR249C-like protein [Saccharomyces kudriavzevii IFO 1802]CAI4058652.1 hypothetical protein SKDI_04G4640 [Saccharomyces kudriavzevii IFO 1802]